MNSDHSPWKREIHFEETGKVDECTRGYGNYEGYVKQADNSIPIYRAKVQVLKGSRIVDTTYTDSHGKFVGIKLKSGSYKVRVSASGYLPYERKFEIIGGDTTSLETQLMISRDDPNLGNDGYKANCSGKITNAFTGGVVEGARIEVRSQFLFGEGEIIVIVESDDNGVKVSWKKVTGASKYRIYYQKSGKWVKLTDTTSTSYTDKTLKSGSSRTYTVRAISGSYMSGYNNGKSIKHLAQPGPSVSNTSTGVKISWSKVTGASKYRIYYQKSGKWVKLTDTTSTSYTDKTLKSGSSRTYTVKAISGSYVSSYNSGKTIKRLAQPVVSVSEAAAGKYHVNITWEKIAGTSKYRIYYRDDNGWVKLVDTTSTSYLDKTVTSGVRTYTVKAISGSYVSSYCSGVTFTHTHTFVDTVDEAATCTEYGLMNHTCSRCGIMYTTELAPIGHSYTSEVTTEATCETDGVMTYTCKNCGDTYTEAIPAIGHNYTSEVTKESSCEETGILTYTCKNCGDTYTEAIPAVGHNYTSEVTKESSCEETGILTYTCSKCGDVYTEEISMKDHIYTAVVTKEASCTEAGVKTYTCSGCGDVYTEEISAVGHNYTETVTKVATCEEDGIITHTCTNCGDSYDETIAAYEHDWVENAEEINRAYHICNACGEKFYVDEYASNADAIKAWINHDCSAGGGSYSTYSETVTVVTGYTCSKCGSTKDAE